MVATNLLGSPTLLISLQLHRLSQNGRGLDGAGAISSPLTALVPLLTDGTGVMFADGTAAITHGRYWSSSPVAVRELQPTDPTRIAIASALS